MTDKQNITIKLAGLPKIPLQIERSEEEVMRRAEKLINDLWAYWSTNTFAAESQQQVMARVAFQFALLYLRSERSAEQNVEQLRRLNEELGSMLSDQPHR